MLQQDPSTLGEVLEDVTRLGERRGSRRGRRGRRELEGRLEAVRAAVAGRAAPRVLALEWLDPPFLGGHWVPEMIEIAGGEDVAGPPGQKSPQVEWEDLAGARPRRRRRDALRLVPGGLARAGARAPRAPRCARRRARLAVDAASTFSRPGPRLVDGVELLAHLFHPERVQPPEGIGFAELTAQISRS